MTEPTTSTPPVRRTQADRRNQSEEALLDAAAELISERGVDGASLASIGERAGVSRGLPSHHFGSKDGMVARLAARVQDRIQDKISEEARRRYEARADETSGLDVVRLTVDIYLELFANPTPDQRALLVMWGSTFASNAAVEGMEDAERRSYDGLAGWIVAGQADGSVRLDVDPVAAAVLVLGTIRGVAALVLTDSALVEMSRVRETCRVLIDGGLAR